MATIKFNGSILHYQHENLTYETTRPITIEDGKELLQKTKYLFDSVNLKFYLTYGTLLGAIRDKTIIKGDEDLDVFIWDENLLLTNLSYFADNGLKVIRAIQGILYSFRINERCYIDVYILKSLPIYNFWSIYCFSLNGNYIPKTFFQKYSHIRFLGEDLLCPNNPEKLLEFWYGNSWRIPQQGHKFIYEVKSAYYWHQFINKTKSFIKFIIGWKYWKDKVKYNANSI